MAPFAWQSNQAIVFCFSQKLCFQDLIQCRILKPNSASIFKEQSVQFSRTVVTPWAAVPQASLSITNAQSLLKLMSIESVMLSNHLILCCPLLLPPSIFPSTRVFSNESVLCIRWPKYWSFSFNIRPLAQLKAHK